MKHLDGVSDAKVNFGASKLTVYGETTIKDLEKAGAFEKLKVTSDSGEPQKLDKEPFLKKNKTVILSSIFLGLGFIAQSIYGEGHLNAILLFIVSMVIGGFSLFKVGVVNLIRLQFDMKTLMTVAVIGAAIIGEWTEGAIVVILFAISEALERYSMDKARQSIRSLMDIAPKEATIRRNGKELVINVRDIEIGDIMIVKPGQKIAMDGVVISGYSAVNQAAVTGESVPVEKTNGDSVFAGTLNEEGLLEVEVTKHVDDTTIAKIIHLVEEAQGERAPSQAFIDRFAKYYTPIIMIIAALIAIIPPLVFDAHWTTWLYQGLAVLVVGCPCALVISTPVSIVTAIGNAAKNGILVKGGVYLEEAGALKAIAFDKTGTLTKGEPVVTDLIVYKTEQEQQDIVRILTALEYRSGHPLASAIVKKAEQEGISYKDVLVEDFSSLTGKGIKGVVEGTTYFVGSPALLTEILVHKIPSTTEDDILRMQDQGKTVMMIGTTQQLLAIVAVADEARETSREVIKELKAAGIHKTIMLTGDNHRTATAIGQQIGVTVQSELMPEDKLTYVKELRSEYGKVAMVGDGVNDAPALAASTVGIAMGGAGTDTALETADIALMGDDLKKLPYLIRLSHKTMAIIKQNISFSIGIKLLALLLVVPGWLTLWIAILADMGATIIVTLNSLRLLRIKDKK